MDAGLAVDAHAPSNCEVAIIGAGPVGLMLANLLGMAGRRHRRARTERRAYRTAACDRL